MQFFLLATDAANASEEFLLREARAFLKLWLCTIAVLTPMQTAVVLTTCTPLIPHLPDVCAVLLNDNGSSQTALQGQSFSFTNDNKR
jgi:hypothetical protein